MIKDENIAKQISDLLLDYSRGLDRSIALVKNNCDSEEFNLYRRVVGKILGEIYLDVLTPLYQQHPELKPEGMN